MKASVKRAIILSVVALGIAGIALVLWVAIDFSGEGSETTQQEGQGDQDDDGGQQADGGDEDGVKVDLRPCVLAKADIVSKYLVPSLTSCLQFRRHST